MFLRLIVLATLSAYFCFADVSQLVKSGNGFLYDVPVNVNLPLAPLDWTNDERTAKAYSDAKASMLSTIKITIASSLATSASVKTSVTIPAPKKISSRSSLTSSTSSPSTSYHNSAKSGYNYAAPVKPFFIA